MNHGVCIPNFKACSYCDEPIYPDQEKVWISGDWYHKDCYEWQSEQEMWEDDRISWEEAENFPVAQ